jgi:hypothetical protein
MANLLDYLYWRGDLDFSISPFNEVDAAVFSMLSYLDIKDFVPGCESDADISIAETAIRFFSRIAVTGTRPGYTIDPFFNASLEKLLRKLPDCPRFKAVRISRFAEETDVAVGRQFAGLTFTLPDANPQNVVAFRGTDKTLVGWKEDFKLAYLEQIPAQQSAHQYLERTLAGLPGRFSICGHSKGGNLAVYAASHIAASDQDRIVNIYNFDGPGFDFSILDRAPYALCEEKILNLVPEESMIGMLFDSVGARTVVASASHYASQHNAFRWEVERTQFTRATLADVAKLLDHTLNTWLTEVSQAERQAFLEAFFDLLEASEGITITSDPLRNLREIKKTLRKYSQMDQETRTLLNQVFGFLSKQTRRTVSKTLREKLQGA